MKSVSLSAEWRASHLAQVVALLQVVGFDGVSHLLVGHSEGLDRFLQVLPQLKTENKTQHDFKMTVYLF